MATKEDSAQHADGGTDWPAFWRLAAEAEREVKTWPAWKRRAAERVFV